MKKIREEISKKEVDTSALQNEIARVKVDALNTKAHNEMLLPDEATDEAVANAIDAKGRALV